MRFIIGRCGEKVLNAAAAAASVVVGVVVVVVVILVVVGVVDVVGARARVGLSTKK